MLELIEAEGESDNKEDEQKDGKKDRQKHGKKDKQEHGEKDGQIDGGKESSGKNSSGGEDSDSDLVCGTCVRRIFYPCLYMCLGMN